MAVSVGAIIILVGSVDLGAAVVVLGRAAPLWVAVMVVTVALDVACRGLRWRGLLGPIAPLPVRRVLGYVYIGYLANNVLPARLGELIRAHLLGEREGFDRATVLGTVIVERVIDTATVVAVATVAIVALSISGILTSAVALGAALAVTLVLGLALLVVAHRLPGADRVAARIARWPRIAHLGSSLRDGLAVAGRPWTVAIAVLLGLVAWSASIATFLAAGQALGVELTVAQGALLCSGVVLATIVPSGPGYLGTFELTAVGIAAAFGIATDTAFAMALIVHATLLAVTSVGGIVALIGLGIGRPAAALAR
jgi:uncharacterized protein (TIRG00374 family)